jgi:hypothetical protein
VLHDISFGLDSTDLGIVLALRFGKLERKERERGEGERRGGEKEREGRES